VWNRIEILAYIDLKHPVEAPLCQRSCRPDRIGTSGGADIGKWLDTDKRIKTG